MSAKEKRAGSGASRKRGKPPLDTPKLEVAVVGSGIRPEDLDIRQLSQLLATTSAVLDAIAADQNRSAPRPSLKSIRRGSAVAVLWSEEDGWEDEIVSFYQVVASRAEAASERVRSALHRLYRSVTIGAIRVAAVDLKTRSVAKPIVMAQPLEVVPKQHVFGTTFYGRVVGVNHYTDRVAVKIEHVDGGREEFAAEPSIAEAAARLFGRSVRADVEMSWDESQRRGVSLRELRPWAEIDFVDALMESRAELRDKGVKIDFDAMMKEIDG